MKKLFALLPLLALLSCQIQVTRMADVVFLGDSITAGNTLPNPSDGWVAKYISKTGRDSAVNAAVSGNTTEQMLARITGDVLAFRPSVVFVLGGVNDIRSGATAEEVEAMLSSIYSLLAPSKVIVCTLTPFPGGTSEEQDRVLQLNKWIASRGLPCVDFFSANPEISIDGLHPDAAGNSTMADAAAVTVP